MSQPAPGSQQALDAARDAFCVAIVLHGEGSPKARQALKEWLQAIADRNQLLKN